MEMLPPVCRRVILGLLLLLLFAASFSYGDQKTVQVVGVAECADCQKHNIQSSHASKGLKVSVECKLGNGEVKTRGVGEVDEEGKFQVVFPNRKVKKEECYAQLHSASNTARPCAYNGTESSKIGVVSEISDGMKQTFRLRPVGKLKFSAVTCTSAFLWPFFKYPSAVPIPDLSQWPHPNNFPKKSFPKLSIPHLPLPSFPPKTPCPPFFKKPLLPPLVPIFKKPILPPVPVFKKPLLPPLVPIFKKPCPPPPVPVYVKPLPPPVPIVKKPLPPPVPVYHKPFPPPVPVHHKPIPPPVPVYHKPIPPPVPVYRKPLPPPVPIFKKPSCPPNFKKPSLPPFPHKQLPPIPKLPPFPHKQWPPFPHKQWPPIPKLPPFPHKQWPPIPKFPPFPHKQWPKFAHKFHHDFFGHPKFKKWPPFPHHP